MMKGYSSKSQIEKKANIKKVKYSGYKPSTTRAQRIGIWGIAVLTLFGTLAGFIFMAMASMNPSISPANIANQELEKRQKEQAEALEKEHKAEIANLEPISYDGEVKPFSANDIKNLSVKVLKEGKGAVVDSADSIKANYTGWTPDGKIFDSTKKKGQALTAVTFSLKGVIEGWGKGLNGKKVGGVYLLTIPSDLAYGQRGAGSDIKPNTPLKFIVEIVSIDKK